MSGKIVRPKNLIVRMPNWLGDLVMATPVLRDLRRALPETRITAMAQSNVAPLLREDPNIDELYSFSRPSGWLHRPEHRGVIRKLRQGDYDSGLLLTNSFSSAWWFWRSGISARVGFDMHYRSFLLTHPLEVPKTAASQHQVITYKGLLAPFAIAPSDTPPKLYLSEEEQRSARELLSRHGVMREHILIGINPGAAYGSAKCWLPSRFRHVTQRLLENPAVRVVYFGDSKGKDVVQEICMGLPDRVVNLAGGTGLRELMGLIDACDILLTNDSGPMHVGAALGTPLLALFGSTCDVKTGPFNQGRVIHKHVECSPCYERTCPLDFRCMTRIGVEEVYAELQKLISETVKKV